MDDLSLSFKAEPDSSASSVAGQSSDRSMSFVDTVSPQEYAARAKAAGVSVGRSPEEQEDILRKRGFSAESIKAQVSDYKLAQAKQSYQGQTPGGIVEQFGRMSMPFGDFLGVRGDKKYAEAKKKFNEGDSSPEVIDKIARYEQLQKIDQDMQSTTGGAIIQAIGALPKIAGEAWAGGKVLKVLGGAIGGRLGSVMAGTGSNETFLAAAASHAGRMALLTPMMPSMYLEEARQRNIEEGRLADDPRGFPGALLHGYSNMLVLGSLQAKIGGASVLSRIGKKAIMGLGEQAGVDVAGGLWDEVAPDILKTKTRYGVIGDLARGKYGDAAHHATVQALTFAMFSALHEGGTSLEMRDRVREEARRFADELDKKAKAGHSVESAAEKVGEKIEEKSKEAIDKDTPKPPEAPAATPAATPETPAAPQVREGAPEAAPKVSISKAIGDLIVRSRSETGDQQAATKVQIESLREQRKKGVTEVDSPIQATPQPPTIAPAAPETPPTETPPAPEIVTPGASQEAASGVSAAPETAKPPTQPSVSETPTVKKRSAPPLDVSGDHALIGGVERAMEAIRPGQQMTNEQFLQHIAQHVGRPVSPQEITAAQRVLAKEHSTRDSIPVQQRLYTAIDRSANLSPEQRDQYKVAINTVLSRMPESVVKRFGDALQHAKFFPTPEAAGEAMIREYLKRSFITPEMRTAYEAEIAGGRSGAGVLDGVMYVDGGMEGYPGRYGQKNLGPDAVQAHEAGHILDGMFYELTTKYYWKDIWESEIKSESGEHKLTEYASTDPREGFAEFSRLLYGSDIPTDQIAKHFPYTTEFFKDHKLWPKERKGPEKDVHLPEVFDEKVPLGGKGEHVDTLVDQVRDRAPEKLLTEEERLAAIEELKRTSKQDRTKKGDDFILSDEAKDSLRGMVIDRREQMVLESRITGTGFTNAGRQIGVTAERARQIQNAALKKIGLPEGDEGLDKLREMFAPKITEEIAADLLARKEAREGKASPESFTGQGRTAGGGRRRPAQQFSKESRMQYMIRPGEPQFLRLPNAADVDAVKEQLWRAADWMKRAVTGGKSGLPPGIKLDSTNRFPRFQDQNESKKILSDPQGVGRVPFFKWLFDPLRSDTSPEAAVFVANQAQKETGTDIGVLYATTNRKAASVFDTDPVAGEYTRGDGTKGRMRDDIVAEMLNPGSQTYMSPEQKSFVHDQWTPDLRDLQKFMREEGLKKWVDEDGNPLTADAKAYFPQTAIGKQDVPGARTRTGGARPGSRASFQRGKFYKTEAEGAADGIIYDPSAISRASKFVADVYRVIADRRMANDPTLQGKTVAERYAERYARELPILNGLTGKAREDALADIKYYSENPSFQKERTVGAGPAFQGKIYPKEIAERIEKQFARENSNWIKDVEKVSSAAKGVMLGGDASFMFIQTLPLLFRNPKIWAKANWIAIKSMWHPEAMAEFLAKPENAAAARELTQVGSSVGRLQDFMSGLQGGEFATRLPVVGKAYAAAGRGFGAALDVAKIELWKAWSRVAKPHEYRAVAEAIDSMLLTGRMEGIGLSPQRVMTERLMMLAPSYYRGGLNLIATAFQRGTPGKIARQAVAATASGILIASVAAMKLLGVSDEEVQERLNPARGKFLKVPIEMGDGKKLEMGTSNILTSYVRLLGMGADHFWSDKPIDTGADGNPILRWLRGKAAFAPRLATDIMTGKDYFGNRMEPQEAVLRSFEPLVLQQMLHGEGGTFEKGFTSPQAMDRANVADAMVSLFGFSSYPGSPADARNAILNSESRSRFGKDYLELSIGQQSQVVKAAERREDYSQKKPPTAAEIERAMALEVERQSRLTRSIADGNRDKLNALSKQIPSYQGTLEVNGERVPMGRARMQRYEELLVEEYDKAIGRWDVSSLKSRNPKAREDWMRSSLEQAKERAKKRLVSESSSR